jgi:lipopolysaccharide export LptBFGC system permease protein LptF
MKKTLGVMVCAMPNISYLVGTFLPGMLLLIAGLWLLQNKGGGTKA